MDGPKFMIAGVEYPVPTQFRIPDPALVREITGMDWATFMQGLREEQEDPVLVSGLVAVAVSQANPAWPRAKVLRFLQDIDWGALEAAAAETNGAGDAGPPAQGGGSGPVSQPSTSEPNGTPAADGTPTPASGGAPL